MSQIKVRRKEHTVNGIRWEVEKQGEKFHDVWWCKWDIRRTRINGEIIMEAGVIGGWLLPKSMEGKKSWEEKVSIYCGIFLSNREIEMHKSVQLSWW